MADSRTEHKRRAGASIASFASVSYMLQWNSFRDQNLPLRRDPDWVRFPSRAPSSRKSKPCGDIVLI